MNSKKKVLFFIEDLGCGGAEKSLVSLLQLLDYDRLDVDLLLSATEMDLSRYVPKQVNIIHINDLGYGKGLLHKLCSLYYSLRWRVLNSLNIKRHRAETFWGCMAGSFPKLPKHYDVAIAYQQGLPTYYVATKVKAPIKLAWVNADIVKAGYRESFNAPFYRRFTHIVAVSEELKRKMASAKYADASKLTTIYDILNVTLIRKMAEESIKTDADPSDAVRITTVGRLEGPKNYPLAVETAHILKTRGVDFVWTFVGEGKDHPLLEQMVEKYGLDDNIKFTGLQINPYPYIKSADIYVQTSSFEGFGLTIAEAKILHKPIVSTNFSVVTDQITDGKNGLIAKMTPESVADKIVTLISDSALRQRLIEETRRETNTTATTEVEKFYKLL